MKNQIMCKMPKIETEFSPKSLECLIDIMGDDDEFDNDNPDYQKLYEKDGLLFQGEEVTYGLWICKIVEVEE